MPTIGEPLRGRLYAELVSRTSPAERRGLFLDPDPSGRTSDETLRNGVCRPEAASSRLWQATPRRFVAAAVTLDDQPETEEPRRRSRPQEVPAILSLPPELRLCAPSRAPPKRKGKPPTPRRKKKKTKKIKAPSKNKKKKKNKKTKKKEKKTPPARDRREVATVRTPQISHSSRQSSHYSLTRPDASVDSGVGGDVTHRVLTTVSRALPRRRDDTCGMAWVGRRRSPPPIHR